MTDLRVLWEECQRTLAEFNAARDMGAERATKKRLWEKFVAARTALDAAEEVCPTCGRHIPYQPQSEERV